MLSNRSLKPIFALLPIPFLALTAFFANKQARVAGAYNPLEARLEPSCWIWDLASEIQVAPDQENPNRDSCGRLNVWYFLGSANLSRDTQDYYLLPNFVPSAYGIQGLEEWQGQNPEPLINIQWPAIGINVSGQTQYPQYAIWLPNTVLVHPYSTELVIVGWRSPITGAIKVVGSVSDIENRSGDGVLWYIDKDSVNLASGSVTEGGTQNFAEGVGGNQLASIKVKENEFIYFIVHPNENFLFDPTRLDITITHVPLGRVQLPLVLKR